MDLDTIGQFTWLWDAEFFIQTTEGNFVYSDPDHIGGDNTIHSTPLTLKEYLRARGLDYGRDKGTHSIRGYCGEEVGIK